MLMEFRNDRITDMLKIVYPAKTPFCGGYNQTLTVLLIFWCCIPSSNVIALFDFWFYVPVNNYGHVETVSKPNHTVPEQAS